MRGRGRGGLEQRAGIMHFVRSCPATSERAQGGPMEVEKDAVNRYSSTLLQSFVTAVAKSSEGLLGHAVCI